MKITSKHINVFIAYARKDTSYLDKLRIYLRPLHRNKTIKIWYDGEITPGAVWEEQIKTHLHQADIILLLVSANSLASDYFYEKEVTDAMDRHKAKEAIVVPVILSDCIWELTNLAELQALPKNGKPVDDWGKESSAYTDIVRGLNRSIGKILEKERIQALEKEKAKEELLKKQEEERKIQLIQIEKDQKSAAEKKKLQEEIIEKDRIHKQKSQKLTEAIITGLNKKKISPPIQSIVDNMVAVKGGTFQMGDAEIAPPVHDVTLSDFQISKYQVTQEQWRAVMGSDPLNLGFKGCDQCPVERVSWNDIQDFIKKLNNLTGKNFRLPTEAEWEFAARGGSKSKGYQYAGSNTLNDVAWYGKNSDKKTHPVGQKRPNELDLYDMSGNVWEWCSDRFDKNYYKNSPTNNPKGAWAGILRVLRGGSWNNDSGICRVSYRSRYDTYDRSFDIGFRVAQD